MIQRKTGKRKKIELDITDWSQIWLRLRIGYGKRDCDCHLCFYCGNEVERLVGLKIREKQKNDPKKN